MSETEDPLGAGLDKMALDILAKVKVGEAIDQATLKAMEVLAALGKWYAIKNKVAAAGGDDGEGTGIDGYKRALSGEAGDRGNTAAGHIEPAGNAAESDRTGAAGGAVPPRKQARKPGKGDFAAASTDTDIGGADLDRIMASLPGHVGGAGRNRHGIGGAAHAAARGGDSGGVGVEDAGGESDLDGLID